MGPRARPGRGEMTSPNIHFQFLLIPSSDTHGRPAIGEKFHFEQARAAQERFDWGRGPRLPPRRVLEACGEAPLSRDCSQGGLRLTPTPAIPPAVGHFLAFPQLLFNSHAHRHYQNNV